ncbi:MAG: flagella basal body P-ring formation protein FlgA [Mesoaciditoga sp.]|nr:MAG: flagella basal body P-ring formation protein FlgA [Mesoaciditoga sp.]HEU24963.1 flagellar basal body P-ring formation protein FlgA [Mesoaciditoga lauensis]
MKKFLSVAFLILIEIYAFGLGIDLTLKSSATVSSEYVTLYDLAATFTGVSASDLKNFIVAFAPQPGTYYYLDAQSIKIRAEQSIKWLKVIPTSKEIMVYSTEMSVDLLKIQKAIATKVGTSNVFVVNFQPTGIRNPDYEIEVSNISQFGQNYFALVRITSGQSVSYSNATFEIGGIGIARSFDEISRIAAADLGKGITLTDVSKVKLPKFDEIAVGRPFKISGKMVGVPVNIIQDGKVVDAKIIKYVPKEIENVIVASVDINYGQRITADMIKQMPMDVYATTTAYATLPSRIIGNLALWSFKAGQIISPFGISTPPDVMAGQIIVAYVSYNNLTVTTFVRVMQNGYIGQIIPVRNIENGYLMYGLLENGPKVKIYGGSL